MPASMWNGASRMAKQRIPTYREEINAARRNLTDCGSIPRTFKMFLDFVLSKVNHKSKVVWHKQSTIAARLPCSVTTVERATRAAVEVGAVIVIYSSDRQARAEGVGVRSHHRYHNFLRPCLDWPGYNREPIPDEQRAAIKAIMAGRHGHGSGAKKTRERDSSTSRISSEGPSKPVASDGLKPVAGDGPRIEETSFFSQEEQTPYGVSSGFFN